MLMLEYSAPSRSLNQTFANNLPQAPSDHSMANMNAPICQNLGLLGHNFRCRDRSTGRLVEVQVNISPNDPILLRIKQTRPMLCNWYVFHDLVWRDFALHAIAINILVVTRRVPVFGTKHMETT